MTFWTLRNNGVEKPFADWGLEKPTADFVSHGPDLLKLKLIVAGADGADLFAPGSTATVYRQRTLTSGIYSGGTIYFYGMFVDTKQGEEVPQATHDYELRGPWYWLEKHTFRQSWYGSSVPLSKLVLFVDINGNAQTVKQTLTEILNYAIAKGAPLQIGTIDPTVNAPFQGATSLTCAEALQRVLRCAPDCITYLDYTTTPPTIHIRQKSTLSAQNITLTDAQLTGLDLTPLYSSQVPAVVLEFDVTSTLNGITSYAPAFDRWPVDATGDEFGALVANIDLKGVSGTLLQQSLTTQTPAAFDTADFWEKHAGWFTQLLYPLDGGTLRSTTQSFGTPVVEVEGVDDDGNPAWVPGTGYDYEIIDGAVADWMGVSTKRVRITVPCDYNLVSSASGDDVTLAQKHGVPLSVVIETTNGGHGDGTPLVYNSFQGTQAEPVPTGLAQYFYNALNSLYWRGSIRVTNAEVGGTQYLGTLINLPGGTGKYAAINALVSAVHDDLETGETHIEVGPPAHFSPRELLDLLWWWRQRKPGDWYGRKTGYVSGGNTQLPTKTGPTRANANHSTGKHSKLVIEGDTTPANALTLDPDNGSDTLTVVTD